MSAERGRCGECEADDIPLTTRKKLFKHDGPEGGTCPGSGDEPTAAVPIESTPVDDDWPDDEKPDPPALADDPPVVDPPGPDPAPPASPVYEWSLTIRQPALYLDDAAWHQANAIAAATAAEHAGHIPTGEATCTSVASTDDGSGLVLTYTVPIEGEHRG